MKFYISIIAGVIIIRADLLIVNHFRGEAETGVYAVASQVAALLMLLPAVIAMLLFPRVASDPDPRAEFALRVTRNASVLNVLICVSLARHRSCCPWFMALGSRIQQFNS